MRHFLNNIEISPRNRNEIGVVADFSGNPEFIQLNVDSVILPREANELIRNHIQNVGLFEGIPYDIETGGVTLNYYVDLIDGVKVRNHEVEVKLKKRNALDNFKERADGTTFTLMLEKGVIFETTKVPFFIIKDNQGELLLNVAITGFIMAQSLIEATKDVAEAFAQLQTAFVPDTTLGINVGEVIQASLNLIIKLAYYIALVIIVVRLAEQLFQVLFPIKKFLPACYFTELLTKGCEYFGYTFQSDLLNQYPHFALMPVPLAPDRKSIFTLDVSGLDVFPFSKGVPSSSDSVSTFGQFIDSLELMFNAKLIVRDGVVRIERRDWLQNQTINVIEPALSLQSDRDNEFTYNTDEIWKRYYIRYALDYTDLHSVDGVTYDNHDAEFSTEPDFPITNEDLVTIKGLNEVPIPYSLGARKSELNFVEKIAKDLFATIDAVINFFGGSSNFESQIDSRKDCLQISQLYFSTTKILYGQTGAIKPNELIQESNYFDFVSAKALWNNFHQINEIQQNDFIIIENARIRLSHSEFVTLLNNNFAEINGVLVEILKIEWIDEQSFAQITYKQRENYANNKVLTLNVNE